MSCEVLTANVRQAGRPAGSVAQEARPAGMVAALARPAAGELCRIFDFSKDDAHRLVTFGGSPIVTFGGAQINVFP